MGGQAIKTQRLLATLLLIVATSLSAGCGLFRRVSIVGAGDFVGIPPGPSAVLRVTMPEVGSPKAMRTTWGYINTRSADTRFAEFVAHVANLRGSMDVIQPLEVGRRLRLAGLEPSFQPDDSQIEQFAQALECTSYLTANLTRWRYGYVYFFSAAQIEYELACYVRGASAPLWKVHVTARAPGMSDRELAAMALCRTFRWLKELPPLGETRLDAQ